MTDKEKELYKAWLHYREIGDEKRKMEAMNQLIQKEGRYTDWSSTN